MGASSPPRPIPGGEHLVPSEGAVPQQKGVPRGVVSPGSSRQELKVLHFCQRSSTPLTCVLASPFGGDCLSSWLRCGAIGGGGVWCCCKGTPSCRGGAWAAGRWETDLPDLVPQQQHTRPLSGVLSHCSLGSDRALLTASPSARIFPTGHVQCALGHTFHHRKKGAACFHLFYNLVTYCFLSQLGDSISVST